MKLKIDKDISIMKRDKLEQEIMKVRQGIRKAGNSIRDEKCWLDFFHLFELLPEGREAFNTSILNKIEMMGNCSTFYDCMECYLKNIDKPIDEIYEIWRNVKPYD